MESKVIFEVETPKKQIKEVERPTRIFRELSQQNEYVQAKMNDMYRTTSKQNSEMLYIWKKFPDPLGTVWFSGKQFLEGYFNNKIDATASHMYIKEDFLLTKPSYMTWIDEKTFLREKKLPPNFLVSLSTEDTSTFTFLKNPIIKNNLIIEGNARNPPMFDYIHCGMQPNAIGNPALYDDDVLYLSNMHILKNVLPHNLKKGGNALFTSVSYRNIFEQDLMFFQLLKLCFESVFIFRTKTAIGVGFLGVPQKVLNYGYIEIEQSKEMLAFYKYNLKIGIEFRRSFVDREFDKFFKILNDSYLENKKLLGLEVNNIDKEASLFSLRHVGKISNKVDFYVKAGINQEEGTFLYNLVINKKLKKCLEVGMANGISSIYICTALKKLGLGILVSIDPFQSTQWKSNGLELIADYKVKTYHKLIEKKSFDALPELLKRNEKTFDLVFIDGWHTFDYTLVDIFFSVLLMKIGGYMIVDDALHPGVQQTLEYINKNYTMLKKISSPKSFGAYEKISDDTRDWNFHIRF